MCLTRAAEFSGSLDYRSELEPIGVIDIGSNSVRLVVYEGAVRSPTPIFNEKVLCGLGRSVASTGSLGSEAVDRAVKALARFKTIAHILTASRRLNEFKRNPQQFIEVAADAINRCKRLALVDGIKYQRLGEEHYYAQALFETEELTGYLRNLVLDTRKSVYEHVVYDSTVERDFAEALERNEAIKVYAKLPGWFKVPTPLGRYNPDWAVVVELNGQERLYFVVETKSSLFDQDLRDRESGVIKCGAAHFAALAVGESPAHFDKFRDVDGVVARAQAMRG